MRLLLDTHALFWWLDDDPKLGPAAREAILAARQVAVSTVSIWELAIKLSLGKLSCASISTRRCGRRRWTASNGCRSRTGIAGATPACRRSTATRSTGCWWRKPWRRV